VKGKELVIAVAEKLGKKIHYVDINIISINDASTDGCTINKYLHDKAAQILFSDGMAGKITDYLLDARGYAFSTVTNWWACDVGVQDNNGTLTPEKILNVWLEVKE
jgi:hypothetical protein